MALHQERNKWLYFLSSRWVSPGFFLDARNQQMTTWRFLFPLSSGQQDAAYRNPNLPGETTTLNRTGTPESRSMRRISVTQLFLPSLAKHLFRATIHHKRPPPRPWCASDLKVEVWMWVATETPGHSKWCPEEGRPNGNLFFRWFSPSPPGPVDFSQWPHEE